MIDEIMQAMMTDDTNASARLIVAYEGADTAGKVIIDNVLIDVCGFGMQTLIRLAMERGNFLEEGE